MINFAYTLFLYFCLVTILLIVWTDRTDFHLPLPVANLFGIDTALYIQFTSDVYCLLNTCSVSFPSFLLSAMVSMSPLWRRTCLIAVPHLLLYNLYILDHIFPLTFFSTSIYVILSTQILLTSVHDTTSGMLQGISYHQIR